MLTKLIIKPKSVLFSTLVVYISIIIVIIQAESYIKINKQSSDDRLKLSIYFESLCPDSKKFHLEQLKPAYKKLANYIDLELIPYGNAEFVGPDKMKCQHGERECEGNRVMACVNKYGKKYMLDIVATIECLFITPDDENFCIRGYLPGASYDTIMQCKDSNESMEMMREFDKKSAHIDYVPWLELNNVHDEDVQEDCQYNLFSCLCKKFDDATKPKACQ